MYRILTSPAQVPDWVTFCKRRTWTVGISEQGAEGSIGRAEGGGDGRAGEMFCLLNVARAIK
jgi:hypothetical protein